MYETMFIDTLFLCKCLIRKKCVIMSYIYDSETWNTAEYVFNDLKGVIIIQLSISQIRFSSLSALIECFAPDIF